MALFLGIEFGSTRIKAVATDETGKPVATGTYDWENRLEDGIWTYHMSDVWEGLAVSFSNLADDYSKQNNTPMPAIEGIGISAMMHGYLVFDKDDNLLTGFRTWRNTMTGTSAELLTKTFNFNIPQRWSIAHLHHAVSSGESHVKDITFLSTLAVYIHYKLTGCKVAGVGEASGIFPIDSSTQDYNKEMLDKFDNIISGYNMPWKLSGILPKVLDAGQDAGYLTDDGLKLLDPAGKFTGIIKPGIPFCPPEGDAGTGMVATNAITPGTGNVSAGTSIFAMLVLDKALSKPHPQIDMVTTPSGVPVALVHGNNCTADLDAWVGLIYDALVMAGRESGGCCAAASSPKPDKNILYKLLYNAALQTADKDCAGLTVVSYLSGEHMTDFEEGRPLFVRTPESNITVGNFMRSMLFSAMTTLRLGMDILSKEEGVSASLLLGHGGMFKTPLVAQKIMAGALNTPVAVMESAGEGGAWGIALLASYRVLKQQGETLEDYLNKKIFANAKVNTVQPSPEDAKGFDIYLERFKKALIVEKAAVENIC